MKVVSKDASGKPFTAETFLEYLRPSKRHWTGALLSSNFHLRFRGQADANWNLVPSAFRDGAFDKFDPLSAKIREDIYGSFGTNVKENQARWQSKDEIVFLRKFIELADSIGIPTPFEENVIRAIKIARTQLESNTGIDKFIMPPLGLREAFGLAQHYGVPTRFLDWSFSPLHAAFFAAKEIFDEKVHSDYFSVWVLNTALLNHIQQVTNRDEDDPIEGFSTSYSNNHNIRAQKGFFTVDLRANAHFVSNGVWRSQNEVIEHLEKESPFKKIHKICLQKIILASTKAKQLLRLLYIEGISPAHMYPSLENVKATLEYKNKLFEKYNTF